MQVNVLQCMCGRAEKTEKGMGKIERVATHEYVFLHVDARKQVTIYEIQKVAKTWCVSVYRYGLRDKKRERVG